MAESSIVMDFTRFLPLLLPALSFGMSVTLKPSVEAPVSVGWPVTWQSNVDETEAGEIWFRYRVRTPDSQGFRIVRDFSPQTTFEWAPLSGEGVYQVEVTARNRSTGETIVASQSFSVDPLAKGSEAVITPTFRELVFLYSAPPCQESTRFRVAFEPAAGGPRQFTPLLFCDGAHTMNVWIAGLRTNTEYRAWHQTAGPDATAWTDAPEQLSFQTGESAYAAATTRVLRKSNGDVRQGVLLSSNVFLLSYATDLDGNLIWYYPGEARYLTRPEAGGYFFALNEGPGPDTDQTLRLVDLAGNTVLETNAGAINDQLVRNGIRPITSFHHEARRIPGGRILVLAGSENIVRDRQGPGDVDVIGDTILVLNRDLQVEWVWDSFDHLDVSRKAILDEKCLPGGGGCPQFRLAEEANDWLHGNALQLTPDGNILYSARHQDWVIKIDYANGAGTGGVIWRLGKDGDFQMLSSDPNPWFSHQHDANFEGVPGRQDRLLVFDNGNTRWETDDSAHSRGQVLQIDEANRTAFLVLNVDLGEYALALGSAQLLTNGNYHFDLGWMPNGYSQALEFDQSGRLVTQIESETQQYRSFRMRDLYTP